MKSPLHTSAARTLDLRDLLKVTGGVRTETATHAGQVDITNHLIWKKGMAPFEALSEALRY